MVCHTTYKRAGKNRKHGGHIYIHGSGTSQNSRFLRDLRWDHSRGGSGKEGWKYVALNITKPLLQGVLTRKPLKYGRKYGAFAASFALV